MKKHTKKNSTKQGIFSHQEARIFRCLMSGESPESIAQYLGIPSPVMRATLLLIHDKTGCDTSNPASLAEWLHSQRRRGPRQLDEKNATPTQMDCMVLLMQGLSYKEMQAKMEFKNIQTAQNHISDGCKRAGIQRKDIHKYLVKMGKLPAGTPVSPMEFPSPMDDPAFS